MYYREDKQNNIWYKGKVIHFPNGEILENGTPLSSDGWDWSEEEPQEYKDWVKQQKIEELQMLIDEQMEEL
tara:strand:- start:1488 stop:1700 length:213 start_codon:yes stop_codon:yes gene_type:complete